MDNNNWLKQLLMVGVGTTSMVAEKLREVSDEWVREGKINPEQAKGFVDDMLQQIKSEQGNFEGQMERQMRNMLQDLGVPRQAEMDELRGRIDRLERQVRILKINSGVENDLRGGEILKEILTSFGVIVVCALLLVVAQLSPRNNGKSG